MQCSDRTHCIWDLWFLFFCVWVRDIKGYPYWYHYVKESQTTKPVLSPMSLPFFFWSAKLHTVLVTQRFFFPFIWSHTYIFKVWNSCDWIFFFFPDPMSVDPVIMLTVALDGKPYLVEISVLSVSK